jgi:hypothetical protein
MPLGQRAGLRRLQEAAGAFGIVLKIHLSSSMRTAPRLARRNVRRSKGRSHQASGVRSRTLKASGVNEGYGD